MFADTKLDRFNNTMESTEGMALHFQSEYGDISIYMYGAASREGYSLAGIRRALGYFRGERKGTWEVSRKEMMRTCHA